MGPEPVGPHTAWVVGGASGIGAAVVARFRSEGVETTVLDRQSTTASDVFIELSDREGVGAILRALAERTGWPDRLVITAGVASWMPLADLDLDVWDQALAVNLTGAALVLHTVLPAMVEQGSGRVVLLASGTAVRPGVGTAAYAASKAGLIALGKVAALEAAPHGPTVNVVAPGITDTPMTQASFGGRAEMEVAATASPLANPQGVVLEPEEIASAIAYLCAEESGRITGQVVHVNAGSVMNG